MVRKRQRPKYDHTGHGCALVPLIGALFLSLLLGVSCSLDKEGEEDPEKGVSEETLRYGLENSVSPRTVRAYYQQNELRAKEEIGGKRMYVEGRVQKVMRSSTGTPIVGLGAFGRTAQFHMAHEKEAKRLTKGHKVLLEGRVVGSQQGKLIFKETRVIAYGPDRMREKLGVERRDR